MATTTNYGWATPDNTDLVKDGALAIRTLGSSVDTTTKALNPSTTLGDIEYRSATANTNTRLAIGTTGQVLSVSGGVPAWATIASGGGKVLQVVQDLHTAYTTTTSTSMADTGLEVSITPSASTSKILIIANVNGITKDVGNSGNAVPLEISRGGSQIYNGGQRNAYTGSAIYNCINSTMVYLDSPATTSATTYKVRFATLISGQVASINDYGNSNTTVSSIVVLEIGA
jgi:hypothetical protein